MNYKALIAGITTLGLTTNPTTATAQSETPENPDEIIVEGLRLPTKLSESGTSVSVITADDLEAKGYAFAVDALATISGVTVNQNGAIGGLATVSIRGASTDQTLVLLDGVPIGDPTSVGGGYDFSIIDTADIERIEILKGPQSTLWGSDAIGGVVNIITKKAQGGFSGRAFGEGGSFETVRSGVSASVANDIGDIRLSLSGISSDGISRADEDDGNTEPDRFEGLNFAGRGSLNLPNDATLRGFVRFLSGRIDIDGFPPPNFSLADTNDTSQTEQLTSAVSLSVPVLQGRLQNDILVGYTDVTREGNFGGFRTLDEGNRTILRYQGSTSFAKQHRIAFGVEREINEANGEETSINGIFGLYEFKPIDRLTLSTGVRHDDHSQFGGEFTAQASAVYRVNDAIAIRGSWGEGFKAPTIFQLTQTFGALPSNQDLLPETSEAFDIGVTGSLFDRLTYGVTYFNRNTENLIIFAPNFRYENLDRTEAQGIEASANVALTPWLNLSTEYAYIDARDVETGERQIRIPRHAGSASFDYDSGGRLSGNLTVQYNGPETEGLFGSDVDGWVRVDIAGAYKITDTIEFYGRIENLLDEDYQQLSGFGTPGLSGYVGARLAF